MSNESVHPKHWSVVEGFFTQWTLEYSTVTVPVAFDTVDRSCAHRESKKVLVNTSRQMEQIEFFSSVGLLAKATGKYKVNELKTFVNPDLFSVFEIPVKHQLQNARLQTLQIAPLPGVYIFQVFQICTEK